MILKRFLIRCLWRGQMRVVTLSCLLVGIIYVVSLTLSSPKSGTFTEATARKAPLSQVDTANEITSKTTLKKEDDMSSYIQEHHMDLPKGDIICVANEACNNFNVRGPGHAKMICDSYGSRCKGFVYSIRSGKVSLKAELKNKMVLSEGSELFIKRAFAQSAQQKGQCIILPDQFESFTDKCHLPDLDPNDESITKFIQRPKPLKCPGSQLTRYRRGILELTEEASKVGNFTSITYQPIFRRPYNDWKFELGNQNHLETNKRQFKLESEFIRVQLSTSRGQTHVEYHAHVVSRSLPQEYRQTSGLPLSVIIIGIDSLSAAHFQRALPEAYKFMKEEMNSIFLNGYSIVGDGTTPALTALMTGKFECELPEARRGLSGSGPLDRWPHIFKDFKSQGYATLFSEDCPGYAAFNYRLHGFNETPTDHFSRCFWQAARKTSPNCVHSKPHHQIHFDYIRSFAKAYPQQPKFGLFFMTEISHNNLNTVYQCADDFASLLKDLHQGNALNRTLLIVMSDHGARVGEARETFQGKLEERLPLMAFTLPRWFSQQYPGLVQNLKGNSKLVTSPFDLYATFRHLISFPQTPNNLRRGESLFSKLDQSRDCQSTGIAEHYCPCLQWKEVDTREDHVRGAAEAILHRINNLTASEPLGLSLCLRLQLHEVTSAYQKIANVKVAQYLGSADADGRKPMFSREGRTFEKCLYQVQIRTSPGRGLYEASVSYDGDNFQVTGEISRINLYGEQPRCILDKSPHLRKYCLCKDYKEQ